jgi:hypothetical protein
MVLRIEHRLNPSCCVWCRMKNSTYYLIMAGVLAARISPKPLCVVMMIGMLIMGIIAEGHGS